MMNERTAECMNILDQCFSFLQAPIDIEFTEEVLMGILKEYKDKSGYKQKSSTKKKGKNELDNEERS